MKKRIWLTALTLGVGAAFFGIKKQSGAEYIPLKNEKIKEFVNSVEQNRRSTQFSKAFEGDFVTQQLQTEFSKKLKDYDSLEQTYQQEASHYSQLLMKYIDSPNHPDLVHAFEKSDRLLNELLAVNLEINSLAGQLQERYKIEIAKKEI